MVQLTTEIKSGYSFEQISPDFVRVPREATLPQLGNVKVKSRVMGFIFPRASYFSIITVNYNRGAMSDTPQCFKKKKSFPV